MLTTRNNVAPTLLHPVFNDLLQLIIFCLVHNLVGESYFSTAFFILRIKELDPSLLELPAQALQCTLQFKQPKSWSPEIIEEFENITADKCLKMTVVKSLDGKLLVNMVGEDGVLLNNMFEKKSDDSGEQDSSKVKNITHFVSLNDWLIVNHEMKFDF